MPQVQHYDLLKEVENDQEIETELQEVFGGRDPDQVKDLYDETIKDYAVGAILTGMVINIGNDTVLVDIGYKSEGVISLMEFDNSGEIDVGDEIEVLLEAVEDDSGMVVLSKRKADRIRGWERIITEHKEGDKVVGNVLRKIKGGLLVDIGVPVFLPASQVSIRRTGDIGELIGQDIESKIIKIDESRRNIVISRRMLMEEEREVMKEKLLSEIEVDSLVTGLVKNITDFGAFVDLGGMDGLLHITDMSWGRISHPSELVKIDEKIEVMVLDIDREREKVSLGLKQKDPSPWIGAAEKFPVSSKQKGEVVNLMSYGAFVKLEDGIEGLVHISEMSWTRRINHPSEVVQIGDEVEVIILNVNMEKQEISLGMKQVDSNPWETVGDKYAPGTKVSGQVRNIANYGAFIELEEGIDGLLHVSDISWTKKVNHPSELLKKGQEVECVVLSLDQERKRIALGMKQIEEDPWDGYIPQNYRVDQIVSGTVTKITNFGVFVELESGLEGLLHVSELADRKIDNPEEVVKVGEQLDVKVIRVDTKDRKIGLSLRRFNDDTPYQPPTEPAGESDDIQDALSDDAQEAEEPEDAAEDAEEETPGMGAPDEE